jgi:HTH-type transcriptional regulator / antitoxin HigA
MTAAFAKYELQYAAPAVIESDAQNRLYTDRLLELMKKPHRSAEERKYARLLATLIENYESKRYPMPGVKPEEVLAELIEQNNLRQKDLVPLLGPESVVSEIVNGKRALSASNIEKLSQRFHVSPAVFFPRASRR